MKRLRSSLFYVLFSAMILSPFSVICSAITIRHDVADSKYLELGKKFPAVCSLGRAGDGTLIAPQWILTAAHVAKGLQMRGKGISAHCKDTDYAVEKVFIHTQWTDMGPNDIALLKLSKVVTDVSPIKMYTESDEINQIATIVGHGDTRTGNGGQWISDDRVRAATDKIDRADEKWIYMTFDEPPNCTELEGAPGRGDSGGPSLIVKKGSVYVAGVSSLGTDGKNGPGTYGAEDSFVRVSQYSKWINNVLAGREKNVQAEQGKNQMPTDSKDISSAGQGLAETAEGKIVAAYIQAFNAGDAEKMREFFVANLSEEAVKRRPIDERLQGYKQMYGNLGGIEYKKIMAAKKGELSVLVMREKGEWQKFNFEFTTQVPLKLSRIENQTSSPQ